MVLSLGYAAALRPKSQLPTATMTLFPFLTYSPSDMDIKLDSDRRFRFLPDVR